MLEVRGPEEKNARKISEYEYYGIEIKKPGSHAERAYVSVIDNFEELEESVGDYPGTRSLNLFISYSHLAENNFDWDDEDGGCWVEGIVYQGRKNRVRFVTLADLTKEQLTKLRQWHLESAEAMRQHGRKRENWSDMGRWDRDKEMIAKAGRKA